MKLLVLGLMLVAGVGCKGDMASTTSGDGTGPGTSTPVLNNDVPINTEVAGVGTTAIRRLSREEFDRTLQDLLGDTTRAASFALPEDTVDPFDNNYSTQRISQTLIEALENVATEVAERAVEDGNARRDGLVGCTPASVDDAVCFDSFVRSFGRKAFRRPLTDEDVARYRPLLAYGLEDQNFYTAIGLVIQAMLQEPYFVYHVERGVLVAGRPGVLRLNSFEVASRLSFFLWGTMPDETLLAAAENGELQTSEQVRAQAARMLADDRAVERMIRFHAMWMGWHKLGDQTTLSASMRAESERLIRRVVFDEKRDYLDLFTLGETWVTPELAAHYGMPAPNGDGDWVTYDDPKRGGVLSHAAFLQVVSKFGDTSPTQRGKLIRERLMCQPIAPPPPTVNVDEPPAGGSSNCKIDRYLAIQDSPGCGACHGLMDFVGFGLEGYDELGRFRTAEDEDPSCTIDGQGEILGVGEFSGPKALGQMLADNGALEDCAVTQLYRFAYAHREGPEDAEALSELKAQFKASGRKFDALILDLVSQESFLYRNVEAAQ